MLTNVSDPSLSDTTFSDNAMSEFMSAFFGRTRIRCHQTLVKRSEFLEPPSTVWPSVTHFPGGNRRRTDLKIEQNRI